MRVLMRTDLSKDAYATPRVAEVTEKCPYSAYVRSWTHNTPLYAPPYESAEVRAKDNPALLRATAIACPRFTSRDNLKRGPPYSRLTA